MNSIDYKILDGMLSSAANNLQNQRKLINDFNVFPVPDGDTGTNMHLTFSGAVAGMSADTSDDCGKMLSSLATFALRNARGNSGVILSQILRGIARGAQGARELSVNEIKKAAIQGRNIAYRAVMKPTEGTILTVVRNVAEFAEANYLQYDDCLSFMKALLAEAERSLETTKDILPVLKQAGVVDAGGKGVVTLLEGAVYFLENGKVIELKDGETEAAAPMAREAAGGEAIKFLYCTEFLINKKKDRKAKQFTSAISDKGDCMLVIEDDDIVKVHIHTNHPGFVIEQALKLGELTNLKIDNMKYQHNEIISETQKAEEKKELKEYGFVAVSLGDGLSKVFKSLGTDEVVEGGQTMNPSTQDILDAVNKVDAKNVFILPNNKNIIMTAEQVKGLSDKNILVIPTKNIPQGISAMVSFSGERSAQENESTMCEAIKEVGCGQVTFAARDSEIDGVKIKEGDIMGLTGGGIEAVGDDISDCCFKLVEKLVTDDSGVITLYYGKDVDEKDAKELKEKIEDEFFEQDIQIIYGGQPIYYYIISVE